MMAIPASSKTPIKHTGQDQDSLRNAILQVFPSRLLDESSPVLDSLVSILRLYASAVTADDLYYKTEAILVAERRDSIDQDVIEQIRQTIQKEWESKLRSRSATGLTASNASTSTPAHKSKVGLSSLLGVSPQAPITPVRPIGTPFSSSRDPFVNATPTMKAANPSEQIIETLNPHIPPFSSSDSTNQSRVSLAIGTNPKAWNYRYMFERPGMKGNALDDGIEKMTQTILSTYGIKDEDLVDPASSSQESVFVVGRIAPAVQNEAKIVNGKPKQAKLADGLVLEVSRRIGGASRTPMHLPNNVKVRALPTADGRGIPHPSTTGGQLALFPGLIAGFKGRNGGGDAFLVEEILMPPSLPLPETEVVDLLEHQHANGKLKGEPMSVFVASGPFTLDNDLNFTPWHRLIDQIEQRKPDVALFMGPFLPVNHISLLDPNLMQLPQELFDNHIGSRLRRLCESSARTTAILLPSTRDLIHPHAAWPQPMFDKTMLGIHKRVKCLPNPCMFSINEVIFGISTADVLRDLRSDELVFNVTVNTEEENNNPSPIKVRDAMARSVRHVLHSRHFYPLFPASTASDLPLDVSHAHLAQFTDVTPDVLFLPSILTPFAKIVDGTVVVNPGLTAKGTNDGKGSFASLQVVPMRKQDLQDAIQKDSQTDSTTRWQNALYDRSRVDIIRI